MSSRTPGPAGTPPRTWVVDYGDASVDFVNTRWLRLTAEPAESLRSPEDLLDWLRAKEVVDRATVARWSARFRESPKRARRLIREALTLREALYGIYRAIAYRRRPRTVDLERLNRVLAIAQPRFTVTARPGDRFALSVRSRQTGVEALLAPIALGAARLLTAGRLDRLRHCLSDTCGVVFFDRTKNAGRRWCDMARCGALAKMRDYRRRARRRRRG